MATCLQAKGYPGPAGMSPKQIVWAWECEQWSERKRLLTLAPVLRIAVNGSEESYDGLIDELIG